MENNNPEIFKYFRIGDVIKDSADSIWGETKFIIQSFHGNWYLPLVSALQYGKPNMNRYKCNFDVRLLRLVDSRNRPFRKLEKTKLIKLVSKGVTEAKRELLIRANNKKNVNYV